MCVILRQFLLESLTWIYRDAKWHDFIFQFQNAQNSFARNWNKTYKPMRKPAAAFCQSWHPCWMNRGSGLKGLGTAQKGGYPVLLSFQQILGDSPVPGARLLPSFIGEGEALQPTRKFKSNHGGNPAAPPGSEHFPQAFCEPSTVVTTLEQHWSNHTRGKKIEMQWQLINSLSNYMPGLGCFEGCWGHLTPLSLQPGVTAGHQQHPSGCLYTHVHVYITE